VEAAPESPFSQSQRDQLEHSALPQFAATQEERKVEDAPNSSPLNENHAKRGWVKDCVSAWGGRVEEKNSLKRIRRLDVQGWQHHEQGKLRRACTGIGKTTKGRVTFEGC